MMRCDARFECAQWVWVAVWLVGKLRISGVGLLRKIAIKRVNIEISNRGAAFTDSGKCYLII